MGSPGFRFCPSTLVQGWLRGQGRLLKSTLARAGCGSLHGLCIEILLPFIRKGCILLIKSLDASCPVVDGESSFSFLWSLSSILLQSYHIVNQSHPNKFADMSDGGGDWIRLEVCLKRNNHHNTHCVLPSLKLPWRCFLLTKFKGGR